MAQTMKHLGQDALAHDATSCSGLWFFQLIPIWIGTELWQSQYSQMRLNLLVERQGFLYGTVIICIKLAADALQQSYFCVQGWVWHWAGTWSQATCRQRSLSHKERCWPWVQSMLSSFEGTQSPILLLDQMAITWLEITSVFLAEETSPGYHTFDVHDISADVVMCRTAKSDIYIKPSTKRVANVQSTSCIIALVTCQFSPCKASYHFRVPVAIIL